MAKKPIALKKFAYKIAGKSVIIVFVSVLLIATIIKNMQPGLSGGLTALFAAVMVSIISSVVLVSISVMGIIYTMRNVKKKKAYIAVALIPSLIVTVYWSLPYISTAVRQADPAHRRYIDNKSLCDYDSYTYDYDYFYDEEIEKIHSFCSDSKITEEEYQELLVIRSKISEYSTQESAEIEREEASRLKSLVEEIYRLEKIDLASACSFIEQQESGSLHYPYGKVESIVYYDLENGLPCDIQWVSREKVMTTEEYLNSPYFDGI